MPLPGGVLSIEDQSALGPEQVEPLELEALGEDSFDATMRRIASLYALPLSKRAALALCAVLLGAAARLGLQEALGDRYAYVTFYPPAVLVALLGGLIPGLIAAAISAAIVHFYFMPLAGFSDWLGVTTFLSSCAVVSGVSEMLHRTWIRLGGAERRRADAVRLRVANESLRLAISAGGIGAWDLDIDANVAEEGVHLREIFGFAPDKVINLDSVFSLVAPADLARALAALRAATNPSGDGLYSAEYRIRRANDGAERWVAMRARTFFENARPVRMIGVCRDVTEEKTLELALVEKAQLAGRLASVAAAVPGVIFSFRIGADRQASFPYASPNLKAVCGLDPKEVVTDSDPIISRINADDFARVRKGLRDSGRELTLWSDTFRYSHPEKGTIWLEARAAPVQEASGDIVWHGFAGDVTRRKLSEAALAESEARLRSVLDGAKEAILAFDENGIVQSINAAGLRMFGYERSEIVGRNVAALMPQVSAAQQGDFVEDYGQTREAAIVGRDREMKGRRKDGAEFPMEVAVVEVDSDPGKLFVGFARDLSERYEIEARIETLQDRRLLAIGGLAASVAHELNQPLAAAGAYIAAAQRILKLPPNPSAKAEDCLNLAAEQILRSGQIIRHLREFVARGEPDKTIESLHALIKEVSSSAGVSSNAAPLEMSLCLNAPDDDVLMDKVQISQVLLNLIRNAREAMIGVSHPRVTISTRAAEGDAVRVDVADRGSGLSDEVKGRLFQPFLTTKSTGKGLGLSISKSIIEAHDGQLWGESNPAGGTIFSFTLPLASGEMDE
jgi:two-component system sensor kinase FixL